MRGRWRNGRTAVASRLTARCASRRPTAPGAFRLLRYCARPPFALERLRELDAEHLVYESAKPGSGRSGLLLLTPLELLERLAALVPPPRVHRHRYYGVLAPHAPLRQAVTAMVTAPGPPAPIRNPLPAQAPPRRAARYAWAHLLSRIYEVFPLRCPLCATPMRIVAFITEPTTVRAILDHLGEPIRPPIIAPARGPPPGDVPDAAGND
jgi:hypothetical protein